MIFSSALQIRVVFSCDAYQCSIDPCSIFMWCLAVLYTVDLCGIFMWCIAVLSWSVCYLHVMHSSALLIRVLFTCCGVKPCPDPESIRHRWWSGGQDLCFWCRGSPAARVWTSVGAEVGATSESPPKWWPRCMIFTHHTRCKNYCTTHCTAPTPHCSVFLLMFKLFIRF